MRLKIKVKPEDFTVKEVADLPLSKKGEFGVYLLKKRGWNTIDLLYELSRRFAIPFDSISYGGRKDRHALTTQYITIKSRKDLSISEDMYSLEFAGRMEREMGPDLIRTNEFGIVVRDLSEAALTGLADRVKKAETAGFENYFDDQRFGSFDEKQGFWAEKVLKKQFNGAVKIYLTSMHPEDKKEEKERKKFFFDNWRDWQACYDVARTKFEKSAFKLLAIKFNDFLVVLDRMPKNEISMFVSAYQSHLWNEVLRRLVMEKAPLGALKYPGVSGDYIFSNEAGEESKKYFSTLNIPMPGARAVFHEARVKEVYADVLRENGIEAPMFNKVKLRKVFFKSFLRPAMVRPAGLSFDAADDEMYGGKKKISLAFSLPRGSYATMLIKSLFAE